MNANGKIRAGIIGIGNWGRYGHVPVLQLLPKFESNLRGITPLLPLKRDLLSHQRMPSGTRVPSTA
jgi:hypothetical protein